MPFSLFSQIKPSLKKDQIDRIQNIAKTNKQDAILSIDSLKDFQFDSLFFEMQLMRISYDDPRDNDSIFSRFTNFEAKMKDSISGNWLRRIQKWQILYLKKSKRYEEADSIFQLIIKSPEILNNKSLEASILYDYSHVLLSLSKYSELKKQLHKCIKHSIELKDSSTLVKALTHEGIAHSYLGELDSSIINYTKIFDISN